MRFREFSISAPGEPAPYDDGLIDVSPDKAGASPSGIRGVRAEAIPHSRPRRHYLPLFHFISMGADFEVMHEALTHLFINDAYGASLRRRQEPMLLIVRFDYRDQYFYFDLTRP